MDEMVKRVPNFGYQKYLSDPKSAAEIDQNVGTLVTRLHLHRRRADISWACDTQMSGPPDDTNIICDIHPTPLTVRTGLVDPDLLGLYLSFSKDRTGCAFCKGGTT